MDFASEEILIGQWSEHGVVDEAAGDIAVRLGHGLLPAPCVYLMPYWGVIAAAFASALADSVALEHEERRVNWRVERHLLDRLVSAFAPVWQAPLLPGIDRESLQHSCHH